MEKGRKSNDYIENMGVVMNKTKEESKKGRGSVKAPSFIFKKNIKFLILDD